jgi:hypothetical protein
MMTLDKTKRKAQTLQSMGEAHAIDILKVNESIQEGSSSSKVQ